MMERPKLGMLLFIVSEASFFLLLIMAYIFYHRAHGQGPTAANSLDTFRTAIFSVALFASSATAWRADVNLGKQRRGRVRFWLLATIALGATFLIGQGTEYAELLQRNVTISRNLFGTTFFTLTGFHGLHVFVGLVMLCIVAGFAFTKNDREPSVPALQGISWYWHFVDAVWVVIFSVVYLWKFL